jgi:hypothetical protein
MPPRSAAGAVSSGKASRPAYLESIADPRIPTLRRNKEMR